ncbi:T-cell receptor alpha chain V region RL-5 [Pelobates cultripes]|nr:T-cell receptor alpha chain V region RL-5 [Pelobates cultripes]
MQKASYFLLCVLSLSSGAAREDSIESKLSELSVEEGTSVTLSCSYTTSYTTTYYLYWYRHYPNKAPDYILHKANQGTFVNTAPFAKERFNSQVDAESTNLTISEFKIEDSTMYLCGLQRAQCDRSEHSSYINLIEFITAQSVEGKSF